MNDNEPIDQDDVPDWAWVIIDRHDLGIRADCPQAAVTVLLTDAAEILKEASMTAFRDNAISLVVEQQMKDVAIMIADAVTMTMLCSREPTPGILTELEDGTLQRRPADAPELPDDLDPPSDDDDEDDDRRAHRRAAR